MNVLPKPDITDRLREYGNRQRTTWEAAAICLAAMLEIERLREGCATLHELANRQAITLGQGPLPPLEELLAAIDAAERAETS